MNLQSALAYQPQELKFGTSGRRGEVVHLTDLEIYINALAEIEYLQIASERVVESMSVVYAQCAPGKTKQELAEACRRHPDLHERTRRLGQSGLGKSRLIQSIGLAACMLEQRVRYITSGELLEDLTAALADHTIHDRIRFYAKFSLLIIDEFGFDRHAFQTLLRYTLQFYRSRTRRV